MTQNAYNYEFDRKIGQETVGFVPFGDPMMTFIIIKHVFDKPTFKFTDKGDLGNAWWTIVRLADVRDWLDIIIKDHKSDEAKKAFRDFKAIFAELFHQIKCDSHFYDNILENK